MFKPPLLIAIAITCLLAAGCDSRPAPEEAVNQESRTHAIGLDKDRSLITWILQGEGLKDGAVRIDSGSFSYVEESLTGVGLVSEEVAFDTMETNSHYFSIRLQEIVRLDKSQLDTMNSNSQFQLENPTHLAQVILSLAGEQSQLQIPVKVTTANNGTELEGKISAGSHGISTYQNWDSLYVGFVLYTDKN
ncbi:MAG: hypothetical protein AAGA85_10795 [Bacteroidota bacterium]